MMCAWPPGAKFFDGLLETDEREAERVQREKCPRCGGRLDRADYPRKVRGIPEAWERLFVRRLSLCCSREGCRKRQTPPSVRFLGRRVYAAVVVLMASVSAAVARSVPRRTLGRWAAWWRRGFVESAFFRAARARFMPPLDEALLPASLVERFISGVAKDAGGALVRALGFISPVTSAASSFPRDGPRHAEDGT